MISRSARKPGLKVRPPAVAGHFYPREARTLAAAVGDLLARAEPSVDGHLAGLIAPHAGYVYSGAVAASAFAALSGQSRFARVLLIGPPHYLPVSGIAAPSSEAFATPFGEVEIDTATVATLTDAGLATINDKAHAPEHSLEVELPFLQRVLGRFTLVPLLAGDAPPEHVAHAIDLVLDDRTLLVVSTDLSHYLDDAAARRGDLATAEAIERLDDTRLGPNDACGFAALNGALYAGQARGWRIERLDLRNSGDTGGDRSSVVGYGAWALCA